MQLARLVKTVEAVRATSRKTEKVAALAALLRETQGRDAELAALYLTGALPQGRIGVGWRALQAAMPEGPSQGAPLSMSDLDDAFAALEKEQGPGSAERRRRRLSSVLSRADEKERRFLLELLMGEVRQGALEGVLIDAIAAAGELPAAEVRRAAMFAPNVGVLARTALQEGTTGLARFTLRLLSPVLPMLASPVADAREALERLGEAAFEHKIDGARIQLHKAGDLVRVFTRQLQEVADSVPEVVEWALASSVRELVLDGEAIALRRDGKPLPFQVTMRRFSRSKDVAGARREQPLSAFFFDCLFVSGEGSLVARPYRERVAVLERVVPAEMRLPRVVTSDASRAEAFFREALDAGHEGVMAKALDAPYGAGQRGFHWLKIKPAHTLDLVILAAEWGSGRRKGWLSNLHLGARDPASGSFVMLGKTFKGLTDEMLAWQTQRLQALETHRDEQTVYVRPELLAEIAFSDVQESPRYPGGLALRFARVKRFRDDKPVAEADTIETVRRLFEKSRA